MLTATKNRKMMKLYTTIKLLVYQKENSNKKNEKICIYYFFDICFLQLKYEIAQMLDFAVSRTI